MPGVFFDPDNPDFSGNYYQRGSEWERLCNVEFYEHDNTGINQICGIRTHGNRARKAPAKGLKIYAREKYGKKRFKHHFFETTPIESFKHLILKPFSTYWPCVGIQDYLANRMALNLGLEAPNSRPVVVYLNGEYWGVYFLQEKLDDRYLEDHFDLAPEQCNVIGDWDGEVEAGDSVRFEQMMDWLEDADLSDSANYAYLDGLIDVDNFIDYQILETFIANTDWPANNFRCWQSGDSKWRFAFFDGDAALVDKDYDVLGNATYNGNDLWQTGGNSTLLMRRLLENNDFKLRFAQRVDELCGTAWLYDSLSPLLDGVVQELRDEIPRQIERFGYPENMDYWDYGVFFVRNFLLDRFETYRMACADFEPLKISHYQSNTDDFVVYPNPVEDVANIMMLDGRSRVVNYELIDVSGACRMSGVVYLPVCAAAHLPLEVHSGVYLLKIGNQTHKIVKY